MIYIEIIDNEMTRSTPFEDVSKDFENCITTEFQDFDINGVKYIYDKNTNSIIPNPNYEEEQRKIDSEFEIGEIDERLASLDIKRIRALSEGGMQDEEKGISWLEYYNNEINKLRQRRNELSRL